MYTIFVQAYAYSTIHHLETGSTGPEQLLQIAVVWQPAVNIVYSIQSPQNHHNNTKQEDNSSHHHESHFAVILSITERILRPPL